MFNHIRHFVSPWTVACQTPLSLGFSRQVYWSGLPFPPPVNLPDPGIKRVSPAVPALAGELFATATWEAQVHIVSRSAFQKLLICPWKFM